MKRPVRAALGVAMLAFLVFAALALLLPRWLASDAVRERIAADAEAVLGRALRYERIELQWSPPAFVMIAPVIVGAAPGASPLARAPRARWRVLPRSLLRLDPWIEQVVVEGATLSLEDEEVEPAVVWDLQALSVALTGDSPDAPLRVEASCELAKGGHVVASGSATRSGILDLVITLDSVSLANFAPYFDARARVAGAASGTLALAGPVQRPTRASARLALSGGDLRLDAIVLRGSLDVETALEGGPGAWNGSFAVDATDAELAVGRSYRKSPGTSATVTGRVESVKGRGLAIDDVKLHIGEPGAARSR